MEAEIILCNHAETSGGLLYICGGGINLARVQAQPPHLVNVGLGVVIQVPYTATNQAHKMTIDLINSNGQTIGRFNPDGTSGEPIHVEAPFNLGRPPILEAGESQPLSFAINFLGLLLPEIDTYQFVVELDGLEVGRQSMRLIVPTVTPA